MFPSHSAVAVTFVSCSDSTHQLDLEGMSCEGAFSPKVTAETGVEFPQVIV